MLRLILAAVAGGVTYWLCGDQIQRFAANRSREMRETAADAIKGVQEKTGDVLDSAKDHLMTTLQAGQDAVRPAAIRRHRATSH